MSQTQLFMSNNFWHDSYDEIVEKYHDEEEEYIRDKYDFKDEDIFSWEWLTEQVEVFGEEKNGEVKIHRNI